MFFVCIVYGMCNPHPMDSFDYQYRIAQAMLSGKLGIERPISWLNELVPFEGKYYSVFPLGGVLCMVPVAFLQKIRGVDEYPAREIIAWIAGATTLFVTMLAGRYRDPIPRRLMLVLFVMFGSWAWCNLAFGSAWQLALAGAMLGQFGALAFTLINRRPVLAGFCFAIAFGNRTEILLTAPLFMYLLIRHDPYRRPVPDSLPIAFRPRLVAQWRSILEFAAFPFLLGVATLWYNYARFHNPLDFGYARIPGLLNEFWYKHGFFSIQAIPLNLESMILSSSWEPMVAWPYFRPRPFGGSIFSATPFLLLLFRDDGRDRVLRNVCWIAIGLLTIALWVHGNPGGWQFSYRYAVVLLPWISVILLDQRGGKVTAVEWVLLGLSILSNAWAVYVFFWTTCIS
jgi:hypothetical protein